MTKSDLSNVPTASPQIQENLKELHDYIDTINKKYNVITKYNKRLSLSLFLIILLVVLGCTVVLCFMIEGELIRI